MTGPRTWLTSLLSRHRRRSLDAHWASVQELLARDRHPSACLPAPDDCHPCECACTTCLLWWGMVYAPRSGLHDLERER